MAYSISVVQNENISINAGDSGVATFRYNPTSGTLPSGNITLLATGIVSGVTHVFKDSAGNTITGFPINSKSFDLYLHLAVPSSQVSNPADTYTVTGANASEGISVSDDGTITVVGSSDSFIADLSDVHEILSLQAGGDVYVHNVVITRTQGVDGVVELVPYVPSVYSEKINFNIAGDSFVTFDSSSGSTITKQVTWSANIDTPSVNNSNLSGYEIFWEGGEHADHGASYDE